MAGREEKIIETTEAVAQFAAKVASWGPLDEVNRYESANKLRYDELITFSRELAGQNLAAAALVSAWDAHIEKDPHNYGKNVQEALTTAENVRRIQSFCEANPTAEVGLFAGPYSFIMFKTDELKVSTYYSNESSRSGLVFEAPFQSRLTTYGGTLNNWMESSHQAETYSGGYQVFSVSFNDLQTSNEPLVEQYIDPLTLGRSDIVGQFERKSKLESMNGATTHRSLSLPYAMWRLRDADRALSVGIDTAAEQYGLVDVWRDQYRQEIGAKAAHVILAGALDKPPKNIPYHEAIHLQAPFLSDEPELFGGSNEVYLPAVRLQANRLGLTVDDATLYQAVEYLFKK